MPTQHIQPPTVNATNAYTHVVITAPGRVVFMAGQTAARPDGSVAGVGDFRAQAEQVYENLRNCLAAAGATFADVVKTTTYVVDMSPENRAVVGEMRRKYLPDPPPTSTLIGVASLARPEFMLEIDATAVLP